MNKFEYIRRQLGKANRKSLELYITSRIWNKLDRLDVEFVTQQPIRGINSVKGKKLYFTDIYFPQINFHIEIDEGYHKDINQREKDTIREKDIISVTGHEIKRIDATQNLEEIHKEIDILVNYINMKIDVLGNDFRAWDAIYKSSDYYIKKGYVDCKENVMLRTIKEACNIFGYNYKGFQSGGTKHPILNEYFIWFPKLFKNEDWENTISDDDTIIYEKYIGTTKNPQDCIKNTLENKRNKKIVFANVKDNLGARGYRFLGVYEVDRESSLEFNCVVYRKINDRADTFKPLKI